LEEIKVGLDGNLCRCTGYTGIFEAIQACAVGAK
jgi:aerobic-type carbon monoxide dehydrogenase small subunit (CoxS/CutS family)